MRKAFCMTVLVLIVFLCGRMDTYASTENDLREVMGLERIEGSEWEKTAAKILSQCREQKNFNSLVDEITSGSVKDEEAEILAKQIEEKNKYYDAYMNAFTNGDPAWKITDILSDYDRLYRLVNGSGTEPSVTGELEKYDGSSIEKQEAYARTLQDMCKNSSNIGKVGLDANTFLRKNLRIAGVTENSVTCFTTPGDRVYAQFTGKISSITSDTVTISAGSATEFTVSGIKPVRDLKTGQKIRQYTMIGTAKTDTVQAEMVSCMNSENPLKIYGTRACYWLDEYLQTEPWTDKDRPDLSRVKDCVDHREETDENVSTMTDKEGNKKELTIEDNPYRTGNETVLPEDIMDYLGKKRGVENIETEH